MFGKDFLLKSQFSQLFTVFGKDFAMFACQPRNDKFLITSY